MKEIVAVLSILVTLLILAVWGQISAVLPASMTGAGTSLIVLLGALIAGILVFVEYQG